MGKIIAKKRFGQNFLHNHEIIKKIAQTAADQAPSKHLLEIGPGRGALTEIFLKEGFFLDAVELDRDLVAFLSNRFHHFLNKTFFLHSQDILTFPLKETLENQKIECVVGNLPYNISTPLLVEYAQLTKAPPALFLIQKEVAQRLVGQPGSKNFGRLSLAIQHSFDVSVVCDVGPENFYPQPQVQSQVVLLTPKESRLELHPYYQDIIDEAFQHRRKTLKNALPSWEIDFHQAQINPQLRPEDLSQKDFVTLASFANQKKIT